MNRLLFCQNFPPVRPFSLSFHQASLISGLLIHRSGWAIRQLSQFLLRRSESVPTWFEFCLLSLQANPLNSNSHFGRHLSFFFWSVASNFSNSGWRWSESWFRKQKVFSFRIALLLSFLWSSYPEGPGCFPLSVVCSSPFAFPLSGSGIWCVPYLADTRWSNLQSFKERCYRSNFVRVSGDPPTIFRRSWLLSEPVPKNLIKNLSFRVLCLSS
jgi:hypothetical protein